MNFLMFRYFFLNFNEFFRLVQIFICAQVMWRNLDHLIASRSTVKLRGDMAACGVSDCAKNRDR